MRILVPLPFEISHLRHGRNLRIVNLLRALAGRHEITCAAADDVVARSAQSVLSGVDVVAAPLRPDPHHASAATLRGSWMLLRAADFFGYEPALHAWIDRLAGLADVVLGFDLPSALYLSQLGQTAGQPVAAVADLIDDPWLTGRSENWASRWSIHGLKTAIAIRVLRDRLLGQLDALVAVAPADAESLFRATGRPVRVVPNGVEIPTAATANSSERDALVVFTGAMSFLPNEKAACHLVRSIWPRIRRAVPQARLALVGADPSPRVQNLATQDGVTVTGRVDDVGYWLRRARVAVAPMISGTGIKNKVLEACANACPVVATPQAVDGIPSGNQHGILVANGPAPFANQVIQLLMDASTASLLGQAGQTMVRDCFTWSAAADTLESALHACKAGVDASRDSLGRRTPNHTSGTSRSAGALARKEAAHAIP